MSHISTVRSPLQKTARGTKPSASVWRFAAGTNPRPLSDSVIERNLSRQLNCSVLDNRDTHRLVLATSCHRLSTRNTQLLERSTDSSLC